MTDLDLFPVPTVTPGHRLVPALIGFHGRVPQTVWIECPTWCTETHHAVQLAVEDIIHSGDPDHLGIESLPDKRLTFELYAGLKSDPAATDPEQRGAHVAIGDGDGEDAFLTPDMADSLADDLIGFASQLRHLARTARLHNDIASTVGGAL